MFRFDIYYLYLVIPAALIALWAQAKVSSTFAKYNNIRTSRGYTAAEVARRILDQNGLNSVQIQRVAGSMTDHFDPRTNVVRLSDTVYSSTAIAAIGVAAHEVGHAVQYATKYAPMKVRAALIPVTQVGSTVALPLAIVGIFVGLEWLVTVGILLFSTVALFQLVTLPVEFNASSRAIKTLESNAMLDDSELSGAKKVLTAAALTYVAALIVALANLLRLILLSRRNNDR